MFREEKITRKSNLEKNDSLSAYMELTCQQNHYAFETFYKFLSHVKPSRILEIGTSLGGFTQYLKHVIDELNIETTIRSYDIYDRHEYKIMREKGIDIKVENIFSDTYEELSNYEIIDFIKKDGLTLVLCDGGNKVREFNILSEYLKKSDIIMAHDYAKDREVFKNEINRVYWNWHEISESEIQESIDKYNLKPYMQDEFDKAVWVCKIKK